MPDVSFDDELQPTITSDNQLPYDDGRNEEEQHLRLESIDRLFGVLERVEEQDVENKIRVTIRRIARDYGYLQQINNISIERTQGGYKTYIEYIETEDFEFTIEDT